MLEERAGSLKGRAAYWLGKLSLFSSTSRRAVYDSSDIVCLSYHCSI